MLHGLIDGPYLTYRAFRAGKRDDAPAAGVDALFKSSVTVVLDLLREVDDLWVAWEHRDGKSAALRRRDFADYKANRQAKEPEYYSAIEGLQAVLTTMGVGQYWPLQGEADDIALVQASKWHRQGDKSLLWAADKDWLQVLILDSVRVRQPPPSGLSGGKTYDRESMTKAFGIAPEHWTAYLALKGDLTDGVPGMARIGEKRARDLIVACPTMVDLILAGRGEQAVRQVATVDSGLARYAQQCVDQVEHLRTMVRLVTLRAVEVEQLQGRFDINTAKAALDGIGCGWAADRLAELAPDDWDECNNEVDLDEWEDESDFSPEAFDGPEERCGPEPDDWSE